MGSKRITKKKRLFDFVKQPFYRFVFLFFGILLILQWFTHLSLLREPFTYATSWLVHRMVQWMTPHATLQIQEGVIRSFHILAGIDMEIIYECTGVYGMIVLIAGVWATRFPWWEKYKISLIGMLVIFIMNLVRLVTLFLLSQKNPAWFPFLHTYFWQLFLIWLVVMVFYWWIMSMQKRYPTSFP